MPTNAQDVAKYLEFSLLQLGAESYLHRVDFGVQDEVVNSWKFGFNDGSHEFIQTRAGAAGSNAASLPAYNRMVERQAEGLFDRWEVINHHSNDATGFSATLYGKRAIVGDVNSPVTEYTLSMRSTEARPWGVAGDAERDNEGANKQGIYDNGFAFAQLGSMEDYWAHVKNGEKWVVPQDGGPGSWVADAKLGAFKQYMIDRAAEGAETTKRFSTTGYSLSGHLATAFTLMHAPETSQTYTFNGAGVGKFLNSAADASPGASITQLVQQFTLALRSPEAITDQMLAAATGIADPFDPVRQRFAAVRDHAIQRKTTDGAFDPFADENGRHDSTTTPPCEHL